MQILFFAYLTHTKISYFKKKVEWVKKKKKLELIFQIGKLKATLGFYRKSKYERSRSSHWTQMAVTGASGTGWWERMVGVKSQWRSHVNWDRYSILSSQKSFAKSQYGGLHEWNLQAHLLIISWISNLIPIIISIVHLLF